MKLTQEQEILCQLYVKDYTTTSLILAIQNRGVAIGCAATKAIRLLRTKGYVEGYRIEDSNEKLWKITREGRVYINEILDPKLF